MKRAPSAALTSFLDGGPDLEAAQERLLVEILSRSAECGYGRRHDFAAVSGSDDYRRLPFMTYDAVEGFPDYWSVPENFSNERLTAYFLTSGSSTTPKRIPVTGSLVRQKAAAFAVYWDAIYRDHKPLKGGRFIANFGDSGHSERNADNVLEISETTFWNQRMQGFQDPKRWPLGRNLTAIGDPERRYYAAARLALQGELHCLMSLNPSTLVKFCEVLDACRDALADGLETGRWGEPGLDADTSLPTALTERLAADPDAAARIAGLVSGPDAWWQLDELWPELELIICWQSELVEPYLRLLRRHAERIAFRDYITQSSECIIAIPVADNRSGGLLAYTSHYYEFIDEADVGASAPTAVSAWQLEEGRRYEVVVTTGGGLYRYRTADCVQVDGFENGIPVLNFQYRFGRTSSITGEKLTEQQVLAALRDSSPDTVLSRSDVLVFPRTGERPHYAVLLPESSLKPDADSVALKGWLTRFDDAIGAANGEYRDKRGSLRLGAPAALTVADEAFAAVHQRLRAAHVGDEQYKPGVLRRERDLDDGMATLGEVHADR